MYNYISLSEQFKKVGFKVSLLKYYDEEKKFNKTDWDPEKGLIHRSIRFRNQHKDVSCLGMANLLP